MQIKIYFSDIKPKKMHEILNALAKIKKLRPGMIIPSDMLPSPLAIVVLEDEDDYKGQEACERLEQDAQLASEEQVEEPEKEKPEDREYPF